MFNLNYLKNILVYYIMINNNEFIFNNLNNKSIKKDKKKNKKNVKINNIKTKKFFGKIPYH